MAAFTSNGTGGGNWNAAATWNGVNYPGELAAGDTWTILNGDTVVMPWGVTALPFTVAAGAINSGGVLDWQTGFTSVWCTGNITVTGTFRSSNDANAKVIWMSGNVVITVANANTAHLHLRQNTDLHFVLTTQFLGGVYVNDAGKITMEGASSASKNAKISGTSTKECYVIILGNSTALSLGGLNNCTFDYCGQYDTTYKASLNIHNTNFFRKENFSIGNIDVTNTPTGNYGLRASATAFPAGTGTITATAGNQYGIYLYQSQVNGGTFVGTSTSNIGIFAQQTKIDNATLTGTSTSNYGFYGQDAIMSAGTITAASTSGHGFSCVGFTMNGGTIAATSSSGRAFYPFYYYQKGGTVTGTAATGYGAYIEKGTELAGGSMEFTGSDTGFFSVAFGFTHTGGGLKVHDNSAVGSEGFSLVYSSGATYQKTGTKDFRLHDNTAEFAGEASWSGVEPLIYKNHASNKTCAIYFPCSPWNPEDFTTTGAVDFSVTTAGAITVAPGGSVTFPEVQPWDVAGWTAITYSVSGGNSPVYEYRYSVDNGAAWSSWTSFTSGVNLTGISAGLNGNDIIQIRATNGAGASNLTLTNFTITFSYSRETSPEFSEDEEGPLFYPTYAKSGSYITVWATMPDDATTVTATLYTDAGAVVPLSSAAATQKSGTTQWYWSTSNLTTQPTTVTHYRVQFKDQNNNKNFRDLYLGGTEDDVITAKNNSGLIPGLL